MICSGRTLEETAALFDGEKPEQDLAQLGDDAATFRTFHLSDFRGGGGEIPLTPRTVKSNDFSSEIWIDFRESFPSPELAKSQPQSNSPSRRQSQESQISAPV